MQNVLRFSMRGMKYPVVQRKESGKGKKILIRFTNDHSVRGYSAAISRRYSSQA